MYYYYTKPGILNHQLDYDSKYTPSYESPNSYERITSLGYQYEPLSKDIYSITPRKIYPYEYDYSYYWPKYDYFKGQLEWENHKKRMDELDKYYPTKLINPRTYLPRFDYRPRLEYKSTTLTPLRSTIQRTYYPLYNYTPGSYRPVLSPYSSGGYSRRRLIDFLYPSYYLPRSRYIRDPYWWDLPEIRSYRTAYIPRSYITPVRRSYLWSSYPYSSYLFSYYYT